MPRKDLEQTSDLVRSESDQDHSNCYVLGGIDWRGQVLFWVRKEQGGLDHSWGWDRGGGKQEGMEPRPAGRVALGIGCRQWRGIGVIRV